MVPNAKPRMTMTELEQTPEFLAITSARMRFWIRTYLQSLVDCGKADPILATQAAYDTEGENARTFSYRLLKKPKVQNVLRVFFNFGKSQKQIFVEDLKVEIAAAPTGSAQRERLISLYRELLFGKKSSKSPKRQNKFRC
ncbi:MAG TPA: hypothetical protein VGT24_13190 [Candidatus Acidoferrales bacterium]|nr:hypothetical protein [Candidatus Acidoferrales bacterium]